MRSGVITSMGSYGFLRPGVLTFRGSYFQGFLRSQVFTFQGSLVKGFLHTEILTFRGSYVHTFLIGFYQQTKKLELAFFMSPIDSMGECSK